MFSGHWTVVDHIAMTTGQLLLAVIVVLLTAIVTMLAWFGKSFAGEIHDSNQIIAAIQEQAGKDRQMTAVIAQRLSDHIDWTRGQHGPTPT